MSFTREDILHKISDNTIINANTASAFECYSLCANKKHLPTLKNRNHEIINGRRGAGKTILLKAFSHYINSGLDMDVAAATKRLAAFYVNLDDVVKTVVSTAQQNSHSLDNREYQDRIVQEILIKLFDFFDEQYLKYENIFKREGCDSEIFKKIFDFDGIAKSGAISRTSKKETREISTTDKSGRTCGITLSKIPFIGKFLYAKEKSKIESQTSEDIRTFDIPPIKRSIDALVSAFQYDRLYILIDEFVVVDKNINISIQKQIAQIIKDLFFRSPIITVKIASIWNNNEMFGRLRGNNSRQGLELGHDYSWGINLDSIFTTNSIDAIAFFEDVLVNQVLLYNEDNDNFPAEKRELLIPYILSTLFGDTNANVLFSHTICGSLGIPRAFCNILQKCLSTSMSRRSCISLEEIFSSVIFDYTTDVRSRIRYDIPFLDHIEKYISDTETRYFAIKISDYNSIKPLIDMLLDANYLHQYPSEQIGWRLRNKYKMYVLHYGAFLEKVSSDALKILTKKEQPLFPNLKACTTVEDFLLPIPESFKEIRRCPKCGDSVLAQLFDVSSGLCSHCFDKQQVQ